LKSPGGYFEPLRRGKANKKAPWFIAFVKRPNVGVKDLQLSSVNYSGKRENMIYHITSRAAWNEARDRGEYRTESLETEGFIHCSTEEQVVPVAQKFYAGQHDLLLLVIEPALLESDLKWEPPTGGPPPGVSEGDLFPHIYGPINLDAVVKVFDLEAAPDGKYSLPNL
jgi:uncharacterized protein (DUF952 family)